MRMKAWGCVCVCVCFICASIPGDTETLKYCWSLTGSSEPARSHSVVPHTQGQQTHYLPLNTVEMEQSSTGGVLQLTHAGGLSRPFILRWLLFAAAAAGQAAIQPLTLSSRSFHDHTQGIRGEQRRAEVPLKRSTLPGQERWRSGGGEGVGKIPD